VCGLDYLGDPEQHITLPLDLFTIVTVQNEHRSNMLIVGLVMADRFGRNQ